MRCFVCGLEVSGIRGITTHIAWSHKDLGIKGYYDKFLKKDDEGICNTCGRNTSFVRYSVGYSKFCDIRCVYSNEGIRNDISNKKKSIEYKENMSKKAKLVDRSYLLGDKNPAKRDEVRKKISKAKLGISCGVGRIVSEDTRKKISDRVKRDWEGNEERKIKLRDTWLNPKNYRQGKYFSQKNNKTFHYHSSWELKAFQLFDKANNIRSYDVECIAIPYEYEGREHHYIPDMLVELIDGSRIVVEIKPKRMLYVDKRNEIKFKAAERYVEDRGMTFKVLCGESLGFDDSEYMPKTKEDSVS